MQADGKKKKTSRELKKKRNLSDSLKRNSTW